MDHSRLICERVKQTTFFKEINYKCFGIKWIRKTYFIGHRVSLTALFLFVTTKSLSLVVDSDREPPFLTEGGIGIFGFAVLAIF